MNIDQDLLNKVGLEYLDKSDFSVTNGVYPMGTGALIGYSKYHKSGECPMKYKKDIQTWIPLKEDKSIWLGYYKDKEIDLTQLVRKNHKLNTLPFQFGDEKIYQIAIAKYLPVCFTLAEDGSDKVEIIEKYKDIADIAEKYDDIYTNTEKVDCYLKDFIPDIAKVLSKTYTFGQQEMKLLKLINSNNAFLFWVTFLQLHEIAKKIEEFNTDNEKKN
jgi:hypothetical protein